MWIEILLLVLLLVFLFLWVNKKPSKYPPGPWGLPLIGYIPRLSTFEADLSKLRQKYGDVFSWRIGSKLFVLLCDAKIIKETFQKLEFSNRPAITGVASLEDQFNIGVIAPNGLHWHTLRRFMLRHLRDLGMGKSKLVSAIQHEALELVKEMEKDEGKAAPITKALTPAVINVLWQIVASKRYELDDKKILEFEALLRDLEANSSALMVADLFPWMKTVLPTSLFNKITKKDRYSRLTHLMKQNFQYVDEHIAKLDENDSKDFIDAYLIEMEKNKADPDSPLSYEDLVGCLADLFLAGLGTTTLTITFAIYYAIKFPEAQKKLQKEIDSVLSRDTSVTMEDKARLPYAVAFVHEVLRYSTLASLGGFRTVLNDTPLGEYIIPKDAIIFMLAADIHFDPKYYESPQDFRPERFLDSSMKLKIPKDVYLPFGSGKRNCIGESLAIMQLFIFLTTLFQHLEFSAPPGKDVDIRPMDLPLFHGPRVQDIWITVRT